MSYVALYRKYRPISFEDFVGQENVTRILKNQIKSGKISHAYLFSGSRGTGKTSAAKIFARAINCLHPVDGEPCNTCEICKNILDGNTTDVIEMDAASNNSVENIRQIRQEVVYATIDVKYRVYIIDEVHMLTTSAFNALLKTLEEPPENVVFILATTEQHKIPVTILSRCLRFDFTRISEEDMIKRMQHVLHEENMPYQEEAIQYIAKLADGGMRDALSILERCMTENKEMLQYEDVLRIIGAIDKEVILDMVSNILQKDTLKLITSIDSIIAKGKDLRQLVYQITEEFLNILIEQVDKVKEQDKRIIRIIDRLSKLDNELRLTTKPSIVLKSTMIEICNMDTGIVSSGGSTSSEDTLELRKKVQDLEKKIEELAEVLNHRNTSAINSLASSKAKPTVTPVQSVDNSSEINVELLTPFKEIEELKKEIIQRGKLKVYSALSRSRHLHCTRVCFCCDI